jgi:hypothetical protein
VVHCSDLQLLLATCSFSLQATGSHIARTQA